MNYILSLILIFYLKIQNVNSDCIAENIACRKSATQSSTYYYGAERVVDGNFDQLSWSHTDFNDPDPWLKVDLTKQYFLEKVILLGRNEANCPQCVDRLDYFIVGYSNSSDPPVRGSYNLCGQWSGKALLSYNMTVYCSYQLQPARYIIVQQGLGGPGFLSITELQAFGKNYEASFSCPVGLYGIGCKEVCHCLNGLACSANGLCEAGCQQDWSGDHCHIFKDFSTSYTSMGCYNDSNNLTNLQTTIADLTSAKCVTYCLELGFSFAATYNGVECHCGNQTGKDWEKDVDISNCAVYCQGNPTEKCGGIRLYKSVYGVCPPNYFGYKCRFKCHCSDDSTCRYPDGNCILQKNDKNNIIGSCKKSNSSQALSWLPPTCSIRGDCAINQSCNVNGICKKKILNSNTIWFCECKSGFNMTEEESCTDIDECLSSTACNKTSEDCNNTIGSYNCTCKKGFKRNNKLCEDINECTMPNNCNQLSEYCTNTIGSYICTCKNGFIRNDIHCEEINECTMQNVCNKELENCNNTIGSYTCTCKYGVNHNTSKCEGNVISTQVPSPVGLIVGLVIGLLCLFALLAVAAYFLYRFRNEICKKKLIEPSRAVSYKNEPVKIEIDEIKEVSPYSTSDFATEFKDLPTKVLRSHEYGREPINRPKNRFKNITPYDDNRIKLPVINDDPMSDYINATFIHDTDGHKVIATQAPTPDSINDFWRMVMEYKVCAIAMLCNFKENGKVKCDQYWPTTDSQMYGEVKVETEREQKWLNFSKRIFTVKQGTEESRSIAHFNYTAWPDHGVPANPHGLLAMRKLFKEETTDKDGIILIHCSAGAGRTGTFIAIDYLLEAFKQGKDLKVFDCVNSMRNERQQMVQTQDQYQFIYTATTTDIEDGPTVYTIPQFKNLYVNGQMKKKHHIKNQYDALSKKKGKSKSTRTKKKKVPTATLR